jgi:hypothetical protein
MPQERRSEGGTTLESTEFAALRGASMGLDAGGGRERRGAALGGLTLLLESVAVAATVTWRGGSIPHARRGVNTIRRVLREAGPAAYQAQAGAGREDFGVFVRRIRPTKAGEKYNSRGLKTRETDSLGRETVHVYGTVGGRPAIGVVEGLERALAAVGRTESGARLRAEGWVFGGAAWRPSSAAPDLSGRR